MCVDPGSDFLHNNPLYLAYRGCPGLEKRIFFSRNSASFVHGLYLVFHLISIAVSGTEWVNMGETGMVHLIYLIYQWSMPEGLSASNTALLATLAPRPIFPKLGSAKLGHRWESALSITTLSFTKERLDIRKRSPILQRLGTTYHDKEGSVHTTLDPSFSTSQNIYLAYSAPSVLYRFCTGCLCMEWQSLNR